MGSKLFAQAMAFVKRYLKVVFVFSFLINLLMLTAPLYMLQVYDRVLASRSEQTLILLTLIAVGALATLAALDVVRSRLLVRVSSCLDQRLAPEVFSLSMKNGLGSQPTRDLDTLRTFFTGPVILAFFDSPWIPLYLATVYLLHPWMGHVALVGAALLFVLAICNERLTKRWLMDSAGCNAQADAFAEASSRNSEAVISMGILPGLRQKWAGFHRDALGFQAGASDRAGLIAALAKFARFSLQIAILGVGAYLSIIEVITPGAMIAASIIMGRGLAPIESSIAGWSTGISARKSYRNLMNLMVDGAPPEPMPLPAPRGAVLFDNVYAGPPDCPRNTLAGVSFQIQPGTSLGITGPSGAGKSTLAKLMVGIWFPRSGYVRLDNAELSQWDADKLGPYIGYLPQDIELFTGTVAENIARFGELDPEAIVKAAEIAGADAMIRELPAGYDTAIGDNGNHLSGGQRQRIALARAFYKRPPLIVLDEPTSNLDASGESSVRTAVDRLRCEGSTVVIIAHRPAVIGGVDNLAVIQRGQLTHFGAAHEVLPQITRRAAVGSEGDNQAEVNQSV